MLVLILGLVLFLGGHSISVFALFGVSPLT